MAWKQLVVLLVAGAMAYACSTARQPADPGGDPPDAPEDRVRALATILRAEDRRTIDGALREALTSSDPRVRSRAVRALGRIGDPVVVAAVEGALADKVAIVRAEAALALGLLAPPAAIGFLSGAANDPDPAVRAAVADALGRLNNSPAGDALLDLLSDPDPDVRTAACLALARHAGDFDAGPLIPLTRAEDPALRFAAVHALAALGSPAAATVPGGRGYVARRDARAALHELASDPDPAIRIQVARGLAVPRSTNDTAILRGLTRDPDPRVRIAAVRGLAYPESPVDSLRPMFDDPDPIVVLAVVETLGRIGGSAAANMLSLRMADEKRWYVREALVHAMFRAQREIGGAEAERMAKDPHRAVRAAVAGSLADFTGPVDRRVLGSLVLDAEPSVRSAAIAPLARFPGPLSDLIGDVVRQDDPMVRVGLARAVAYRLENAPPDSPEREEAFVLLADLWNRTRSDLDPHVALEVLDAAAAGGDDPRAIRILDDGAMHPERAVRVRSGKHLSERGTSPPVESRPIAGRSLGDYIDIARWASRPRAAIVTVERPGFVPARFTLALDTDSAPLTSWNFARLASDGFYAGMVFGPVIPNSVVQAGDPVGGGLGGPGYTVRNEIGRRPFLAGSIGLASPDPDAGGSRWFVTLTTLTRLDGRYTRFGTVVQNLNGVVLRLLPGDEIVSIVLYEGDGTEPLPPI